MDIYSVENIEYAIKRLLRTEGATSIMPLQFQSIKDEIKSHRQNKEDTRKSIRQHKREIVRIQGDEYLDSEDRKQQEKEIAGLLTDLEFKKKEEKTIIDDLENKKLGEIKRYAEALLREMRAKKLIPKIDDFLLFDKTTFKAGDFKSKVVEQLVKEDIAKHYKRIPADRNTIIEQLKGLLGNRLPKYIIRADIKSFYESVPMDRLLKKLEEDGYVAAITMWYLRLIAQRVKAEGIDGVPRGLAFSAYLTEIYLQRIDDDIKKLPYLYFYQRYVDDMVLLFSVGKSVHWPYFSKELGIHWTNLKEIIDNEKLALHEEGDKKSLIYSGVSNDNEFDYLGYKFIINKGKLTVRLSSYRLDKYKNKISSIIKHYNKRAHDNESLAGIQKPLPRGVRRRKREQPLRRLFGQLSALTGNGMLKGPKSNILTGIYYSNRHLTSLEDLENLDQYLAKKIKSSLRLPNNLFRYSEESKPEETRKRIKEMMISKWSFVKGFNGRRFCNSSSYFNRLNQIKKLCQ